MGCLVEEYSNKGPFAKLQSRDASFSVDSCIHNEQG